MKNTKRYDKTLNMDVYTPNSQDIYNEYQREEFNNFQRDLEESRRGNEE